MSEIIRSKASKALLLAVLCACSGSDSRKNSERNTAAKDSAGAMADMPGMSGGTKPSDTATAEMKEGAGGMATSVTFSAAQVQHGGVRWGAVTMGTASGIAIVPGEVTPDEDRTARLGAPARARILAVPVRPGDRVATGQTLVTMQSPDAGMAQSDVAKAEAELSSRRAEAQYAASAHSRAERLLALKAIPRQDVERAATDDERARAGVTQAEAELRRARATAEQLSAGASASGDIILRAPLAGVVLARSAMPGTVIDAGAPLVVVTDPSSLWLTINAPEQLTSLFHRDGRLRFTVPAYPDTFTARIDAVGAGLEPDTRTLAVRALISNAGDRLKPQMLANVVVEGVGTTAAAFVPEDQVQLIQGKPYVFIAHPDGKGGARFDRREIVLGSRSGGRVAILRGLSASDTVVISGAFAVKADFQKASMPKMEM
ncbi:MAG: efflux RND transporter periplasmic adaptor subunit [Gemmatimonadaceae bacterium]